MALFQIYKKILNGEPIDVFNNGKLARDFTYIDDIVDGVIKALDNKSSSTSLLEPATNLIPLEPVVRLGISIILVIINQLNLWIILRH